MHAPGKTFGKIFLTAIRDTFLSNTWSGITGGTGWLKVLVGVISNRRGKFKLSGLQGDPPPFFPLAGHLDLPIMKTLRRVLNLLTIMILKRVTLSIFFQSNKFTPCEVKDEKEVANSLMAFNLLKLFIHFKVRSI